MKNGELQGVNSNMLLDPPDEGKDQPQGRAKSVVHVIPTLEKTAAQVAILRGIVDTAGQFVTPQRSPFGEQSEPADSETQEAARKTLVLAFHQLDNLIEEQVRWSLQSTGPEADAQDLIKAEIRRISADAKLKETFSQPFYTLRAQLYRTPEGRIMATDAQRTVKAYGDTPHDAVEAFNRAFDELVESFADDPKPNKVPEVPDESFSPPKKPRKPRSPKK
jgi:hypothetical protein